MLHFDRVCRILFGLEIPLFGPFGQTIGNQVFADTRQRDDGTKSEAATL